MILTAIAPDRLPAVIEQFAAFLDDWSCAVFRRIADPRQTERASPAVAAHHHAQACDLAVSLGMALLPGSPSIDFCWNGHALRCETEAYVLLHEIAHFQLAPDERRGVVDFGLGAGPETGEPEAAERAATVFGIAREAEEAMSSLLGVLWEIELGQPGFASFLDQNWLEGVERPSAAAHFTANLEALRQRGLIDVDGRPQQHRLPRGRRGAS